jgi:structural maintenance of chromosome 3 (chondroitin sulfate proteoglycan 6)
MLRQKLDECQAKISDLGALPNTELITKYMSYSSKNLFKELEKANSNIKRYGHVNKKSVRPIY